MLSCMGFISNKVINMMSLVSRKPYLAQLVERQPLRVVAGSNPGVLVENLKHRWF